MAIHFYLDLCHKIGCSHFCLHGESQYNFKCGCKVGYYLVPDKKSCNPRSHDLSVITKREGEKKFKVIRCSSKEQPSVSYLSQEEFLIPLPRRKELEMDLITLNNTAKTMFIDKKYNMVYEGFLSQRTPSTLIIKL